MYRVKNLTCNEETSAAVDWARQMRLQLSPKQILTDDGYINQEFFKPDKVSVKDNLILPQSSLVCDEPDFLEILTFQELGGCGRSNSDSHKCCNTAPVKYITQGTICCRLL